MPLWKLTVTVEHAKGFLLDDYDKDPVVAVIHSGKQERTCGSRTRTACSWDFSASFEAVDEETLQDVPLRIEVASGERQIGRVSIDLGAQLMNQPFDDLKCARSGWLPLFDCMAGVQGQISVSLTLVSSGWDAGSNASLASRMSGTTDGRSSAIGIRIFGISAPPQQHLFAIIEFIGLVDGLASMEDKDEGGGFFGKATRAHDGKLDRLQKLINQVRRIVAEKAASMRGTAVLGYREYIDLEGASEKLCVRGFGTAVKFRSGVVPENYAATGGLPGTAWVARGSVSPLQFPEVPAPDLVEVNWQLPPSVMERREWIAPQIELSGCGDEGGDTFSVPSPVIEAGAHSRFDDLLHPRTGYDDVFAIQRPSVGVGSAPATPNARAAFPKIKPTFHSGPVGSIDVGRGRKRHEVRDRNPAGSRKVKLISLVRLPASMGMRIYGVVAVRAVKMISSKTTGEERAGWWDELRDELRQSAISHGADAVVGYHERASIHQKVTLLSVAGTAVCLTSQPRLRVRTSSGQRVVRPGCHMVHIEADARKDRLREERGELHGGQTAKCSGCDTGIVPRVLLATIDVPEGLPVCGRGQLVEARVVRVKARKRSQAIKTPLTRDADDAETREATEISEALPFLELELHHQLTHKLRLHACNAGFGLRIEISVGSELLVAVASVTGVHVPCMPVDLVEVCSRGRVEDHRGSTTSTRFSVRGGSEDRSKSRRRLARLAPRRGRLAPKLGNPCFRIRRESIAAPDAGFDVSPELDGADMAERINRKARTHEAQFSGLRRNFEELGDLCAAVSYDVDLEELYALAGRGSDGEEEEQSTIDTGAQPSKMVIEIDDAANDDLVTPLDDPVLPPELCICNVDCVPGGSTFPPWMRMEPLMGEELHSFRGILVSAIRRVQLADEEEEFDPSAKVASIHATRRLNKACTGMFSTICFRELRRIQEALRPGDAYQLHAVCWRWQIKVLEQNYVEMCVTGQLLPFGSDDRDALPAQEVWPASGHLIPPSALRMPRGDLLPQSEFVPRVRVSPSVADDLVSAWSGSRTSLLQSLRSLDPDSLQMPALLKTTAVVSAPARLPSPAQSIHSRGDDDIYVTPLNSLPGHKVLAYCGLVCCTLIKEDDRAKEGTDEAAVFYQEFFTEALWLARSQVRFLGGNCLLGFRVNTYLLRDNVRGSKHKSIYALLSISGDAVMVDTEQVVSGNAIHSHLVPDDVFFDQQAC